MNLALWLERAGKAYRDFPAIAKGTTVTHSYAEFAAHAARLAAALRAEGLQPGDRIAIAAKNCTEYLELLYGIWWGGFAAVPINAKLHGAEIAWIVENSGAKIAFASPGIDAEIARYLPPRVQEVFTIGSPAYQTLLTHDPVPLVSRSPDNLAWLFYTSGTTGRPKGAMLSHRNLAAMNFAYLSDVDPANPGDSLFHAAPMSHGSGLYAMAHVMRLGVNIAPESGGFDPAEIAEVFTARPGTSMFAAPTMVKRLVASPAEIDPANIRTIIYGGAPMLVSDMLAALDRFGPCFAQIYGQGETPMTGAVLSKADIANREHPRWLERLGSAGIANSAVELCVADADDQPQPAGGMGEVLVRGDTVMLGYWDNPEATKAALRGGWLHTGDIGVLDHEGYLTLKDRSKDVIISGGANIYPREVEEVLAAHPGVREVAVIGRPDPEWGEAVVAYIVGTADAKTLDQACQARIARFKRPKAYIFVDELPKNNYGKILKTVLREMDARRSEADDAAHPSRRAFGPPQGEGTAC